MAAGNGANECRDKCDEVDRQLELRMHKRMQNWQCIQQRGSRAHRQR